MIVWKNLSTLLELSGVAQHSTHKIKIIYPAKPWMSSNYIPMLFASDFLLSITCTDYVNIFPRNINFCLFHINPENFELRSLLSRGASPHNTRTLFSNQTDSTAKFQLFFHLEWKSQKSIFFLFSSFFSRPERLWAVCFFFVCFLFSTCQRHTRAAAARAREAKTKIYIYRGGSMRVYLFHSTRRRASSAAASIVVVVSADSHSLSLCFSLRPEPSSRDMPVSCRRENNNTEI